MGCAARGLARRRRRQGVGNPRAARLQAVAVEVLPRRDNRVQARRPGRVMLFVVKRRDGPHTLVKAARVATEDDLLVFHDQDGLPLMTFPAASVRKIVTVTRTDSLRAKLPAPPV